MTPLCKRGLHSLYGTNRAPNGASHPICRLCKQFRQRVWGDTPRRREQHRFAEQRWRARWGGNPSTSCLAHARWDGEKGKQ